MDTFFLSKIADKNVYDQRNGFILKRKAFISVD